MAYSRKEISNQGDRYIIELGEARVLYRTYESTGQKVLTPVRMEWLEKRYGTGAVARIRELMKKLQSGELE
jgi:plasmid replication initiation protein